MRIGIFSIMCRNFSISRCPQKKSLLRDYSNKKVSKTSLAALALNALVCLCVPGFGIATEPGLHLKL